MNRSIELCLLLLLCGFNALSQRKIFYSEDGQGTDSSRAYYYSIVKQWFITESITSSEQPNGRIVESAIDTVLSYYVSTNKLKERRIIKSGKPDGPFISYYENGRIKEKGRYKDGLPIGYFLSWYSEGKPQKTLQYVDSLRSLRPFLINYWDTVGRQLVSNGEGFCGCYEILYGKKILNENGRVTNGRRDSVWNGYVEGVHSFTEVYQEGKFSSGVRYDLGKETPYENELSGPAYDDNQVYTIVEQQPVFPGGYEAMIEFFKKNIRYPRAARNNGIEGRVFVGFVVNKNGSIGGSTVVKGVHPLLDEEALRVIGLMPDWRPGVQGGKAVNVRFIAPIIFKLGLSRK